MNKKKKMALLLLILAKLAASAAPFSEEDPPPGSGRFLVVTTQRSGSTWLQDRLKEIGRVSKLSTTVSEPMKMILRDHPSLQYAYNNLQWGDFEFMLRGTFSDLGCPLTHIFNDTTTNSRTKKKRLIIVRSAPN